MLFTRLLKMKKNPRVLIISTRDKVGGAAKAAFRLHQSLLSIGLDSYMLVLSKVSDDERVIAPKTNRDAVLAKLTPSLNSMFLNYLTGGKKRRVFSSTFSLYSVYDKIEEIKPDIINLHWVGDGFLSMKDLKKVSCPVVWTLHDMWPFTGGCHYAMECTNYQDTCGKCVAIGSDNDNDLSRKLFLKKQKAYEKSDITVVALSQWLADCARKSTLFAPKEIRVIPNPIDIDVYKPIEKKVARQMFNLPEDCKLILFGAMSPQSNPIKGFDMLVKALQNLPHDQFQLMVLGSSKPQKVFDKTHHVHYLGKMTDDISLVAAYSAADVVVVPSLYENLSNVILESLSCGTPVASFDIGGNGDMITHQENGYLAAPFDTKDLAYGINWIIEDEERNMRLGQAARNNVLEHYYPQKVAETYLSLFQEKLNLQEISLAEDEIS